MIPSVVSAFFFIISCRPRAPIHSYMDGLIPLLDRFVTDPDAACSISSVVPGRMYSCNGELQIRLYRYTVRVSIPGTSFSIIFAPHYVFRECFVLKRLSCFLCVFLTYAASSYNMVSYPMMPIIMRTGFYSVRFGRFLRSCPFLTDKPRKSATRFSESMQSPREVPSSKVRFSRGVVRVFAHGA